MNREIKYLEIIEIIEDCMRAHKNIENPTLDRFWRQKLKLTYESKQEVIVRFGYYICNLNF